MCREMIAQMIRVAEFDKVKQQFICNNICMYIYIYIYICIYIHLYTHTHTRVTQECRRWDNERLGLPQTAMRYIHTFIHVYIHTYMDLCKRDTGVQAQGQRATGPTTNGYAKRGANTRASTPFSSALPSTVSSSISGTCLRCCTSGRACTTSASPLRFCLCLFISWLYICISVRVWTWVWMWVWIMCACLHVCV